MVVQRYILNIEPFFCDMCHKQVYFRHNAENNNGVIINLFSDKRFDKPLNCYFYYSNQKRYCMECFTIISCDLLNYCVYNTSEIECCKCRKRIGKKDNALFIGNGNEYNRHDCFRLNIQHIYPGQDNILQLEEYDMCHKCYKKYVGRISI